jgi:hypothetical protein
MSGIGRRGFLKALGLGTAAVLTIDQLPKFEGFKTKQKKDVTGDAVAKDYVDALSSGLRWIEPRHLSRDGLPKKAEEGYAFYDMDSNIAAVYDGKQWCQFAGVA